MTSLYWDEGPRCSPEICSSDAQYHEADHYKTNHYAQPIFGHSIELWNFNDKLGPGARFTNDFFAPNSNSMETSPCCNSVAGHQIATIFCTCHDSTAVVPCRKFCHDHCIKMEMGVKRNFHGIWIAMEKPLVKRGPQVWRTNLLHW